MKFKSFFEFAAFDFSSALRRVEKYMQQAQSIEKNIEQPHYFYMKQKIGQHEEVFMAYWQALLEFRDVIQNFLHDGHILKSLTPVYKQWRKKFEEMSRNEDAQQIIDRFRLSTNLFLVHEMVEDMVKGKRPEPD